MPADLRVRRSDLSESGSESSDAGLDDLSGDEKLEALLNNPSARRQASKKRKRAGAGGVKGFTEEDMDDAPGQGSNKRYHKMPSFVASGSKQTEEVDNLAAPESLSELLKPSEQVGEDDDDEEDDDDRMDESEVSSDTDSDQSPASRLLPEETAPRAGLGANMPSSFGRQQQFGTEPKRSFLHAQPKTSFLPSKQPANLTNDEKRHFAKLESTGGIGFKMLSKMGWDTGTGLGAGGEGRVNPVDSQQRPINMGIGYQGFKEKTKQSLQEARRRGEHVSDEEEEQKPKARRRQQPKHEDKPAEKAWKAPPRAKKTQVRHMTYEEVLAQQSADQLGSASVDAGLGQIIDISGAEVCLSRVHSCPSKSLTSFIPHSFHHFHRPCRPTSLCRPATPPVYQNCGTTSGLLQRARSPSLII